MRSVLQSALMISGTAGKVAEAWSWPLTSVQFRRFKYVEPMHLHSAGQLYLYRKE